jgi:hypothetical protein
MLTYEINSSNETSVDIWWNLPFELPKSDLSKRVTRGKAIISVSLYLSVCLPTRMKAYENLSIAFREPIFIIFDNKIY